jgi:hypothetical protein
LWACLLCRLASITFLRSCFWQTFSLGRSHEVRYGTLITTSLLRLSLRIRGLKTKHQKNTASHWNNWPCSLDLSPAPPYFSFDLSPAPPYFSSFWLTCPLHHHIFGSPVPCTTIFLAHLSPAPPYFCARKSTCPLHHHILCSDLSPAPPYLEVKKAHKVQLQIAFTFVKVTLRQAEIRKELSHEPIYEIPWRRSCV